MATFKNKTHKGSKKRLQPAGNGQLCRKRCGMNHNMYNKSLSRKQFLGRRAILTSSQEKKFEKLFVKF
jgi:ribosomal protein L35